MLPRLVFFLVQFVSLCCRQPVQFLPLSLLAALFRARPARQNEMGEGAGGLAHLLSTAEHGVRSSDDEEIVILTQVSKTQRILYGEPCLPDGPLAGSVLEYAQCCVL